MLRHTKSLSNHFALLPRNHRGPVSVLAGYSALFISAPGSYLLSPGSQMKCFFPPKNMRYFGWHFMSFQFIGALHRPFFFIPLTKHYLLGCLSLCYTGRNPICVVLHGSVKNLSPIVAAESSSVQFSCFIWRLELQIFPFFQKVQIKKLRFEYGSVGTSSCIISYFRLVKAA